MASAGFRFLASKYQKHKKEAFLGEANIEQTKDNLTF
jgi:hypothetical protein